jgi:1-acyl-sn-glycerol-3-phosphate acyltransferase
LHRASAYGLGPLFDIEVEFIGKPLATCPSIWVSNHISYLDPILIASKQPTVFVTSQEVKEQFFLGYTCTSVECLFVERRNPRNMTQEIEAMEKTLFHKRNIHLFPEGTTGSGESILPFKSSFFALPHKHNIPIQPIYLEYTHVNGRPVDNKTKNLLYYHGDMYFFPHFIKLLCCYQIKVRLTFVPPLFPKEYINRKELTQAAYNSISDARSRA